MAKKRTSQEELTTKAAELFSVRGYQNTSIADIAGFCGIRKSSVYHYFSSKVELAKTTVTIETQALKLLIQTAMQMESPYSALKNLTQHLQNILFNQTQNGVVFKLAIEYTNLDGELKELVQAYFQELHQAYKTLFSKIPSENPNHDARDLIDLGMGSALMNPILKAHSAQHLLEKLDQLVEKASALH
ncbi:MAG: TetR/AcrR family transcriptional regulator [Legionellales bacterium]|nr:TetR/AcrR family transcriptional regulator [Legionellales bacterium]